MILSMTGYASHELNMPDAVLIIELKSVNHRYLELQLKLDESLRTFESTVREQLQAKLGRGKVDCRMSLKQDQAGAPLGTLNQHAVQKIAEHMQQAAQYFNEVQAVNLLDILGMPGVIQGEKTDSQALAQALKTTLDGTLNALLEARAREGEKLEALILVRLAEVAALVQGVKPMLPAFIKAYQDKLTQKLQEAMVADDERVRQEIVLFAQRIDVDEELARLEAHVGEVKRILKKGGAVGKQLDFLMQEMNREANTLGSKSVSIETTQVSMQLKVLIEQMREQIQNIE